MQSPQVLAGQTAVVTGSSRGIGQAIALELAGAGADIVVCGSTHQSGCEETALRAREMGRKAHKFVGDLSDPAMQDRLVEDAFAWTGKVDIWVNNAGVDVLTGDAGQWDFERKLAALWNVDIVATMRLSRAVGARMSRGGGGTIINIGWDQAPMGMEGDSGQLFASVKSAVMAFSKSLSKTVAPDVRVHCVAPGWIQTAWGENAPAAWQRRAIGESQLGRWGQPEDVARAVRFLASPEAAYLTGQVLCVNGGYRAGFVEAEATSKDTAAHGGPAAGTTTTE